MKHTLSLNTMKLTLTLLTALLLAPLGALHGDETTSKKLSDEEARRFRAAAEYSLSAHGVSVLVMRRGEIIFEDYAPGWQDKPHELASGTKSFAGVMAVCAVQDGLLKLDEKVSDTLMEWKTDPRKSQVTIRQLLSLCSGIEGGENGAPPMYRRAVVLAEATADPGTRFSYGPIPFQCFGELMRRKLESRNESVEAYLKRRILDPIGLEAGAWARDREGNLRIPSGAALTAREWAKFGVGCWGTQHFHPSSPECPPASRPQCKQPRTPVRGWFLCSSISVHQRSCGTRATCCVPAASVPAASRVISARAARLRQMPYPSERRSSRCQNSGNHHWRHL
jgi:CubicO group peptidase (beta-lactamase class C family)